MASVSRVVLVGATVSECTVVSAGEEVPKHEMAPAQRG